MRTGVWPRRAVTEPSGSVSTFESTTRKRAPAAGRDSWSKRLGATRADRAYRIRDVRDGGGRIGKRPSRAHARPLFANARNLSRPRC